MDMEERSSAAPSVTRAFILKVQTGPEGCTWSDRSDDLQTQRHCLEDVKDEEEGGRKEEKEEEGGGGEQRFHPAVGADKLLCPVSRRRYRRLGSGAEEVQANKRSRHLTPAFASCASASRGWKEFSANHTMFPHRNTKTDGRWQPHTHTVWCGGGAFGRRGTDGRPR